MSVGERVEVKERGVFFRAWHTIRFLGGGSADGHGR